MTKARGAALLLMGILLVGCIDDKPEHSAAPVPADTATAPAERTASTAQYARIVGRFQERMSDVADSASDCLYRYDLVSQVLDCDVVSEQLRASVTNLRISLVRAQNPRADAFVGEPPAQLDSQVRSIVRASNTALFAREPGRLRVAASTPPMSQTSNGAGSSGAEWRSLLMTLSSWCLVSASPCDRNAGLVGRRGRSAWRDVGAFA